MGTADQDDIGEASEKGGPATTRPDDGEVSDTGGDADPDAAASTAGSTGEDQAAENRDRESPS